jgi:hypothetical protein
VPRTEVKIKNVKNALLFTRFHTNIDYSNINIFCAEGAGTVRVELEESIWGDVTMVFERNNVKSLQKTIYVDSNWFDGDHLLKVRGETEVAYDPNDPNPPLVSIMFESIDD